MGNILISIVGGVIGYVIARVIHLVAIRWLKDDEKT